MVAIAGRRDEENPAALLAFSLPHPSRAATLQHSGGNLSVVSEELSLLPNIGKVLTCGARIS
jgi:hypothetical protein